MNSMDLMVHFGLGDQILCNAMIRNYCKTYDNLNLFVAKHNEKSVKFMFRDVKNLNYIVWSHDRSVSFDGFFTKESSDFFEWYTNNIESGLDGLLNMPFHPFPGAYDFNRRIILITNTKFPFDASFYENAKLDFEKKWTDFYLERDLDTEKKLYYDILGLKDDDEFIFVHDDHSRGYHITKLDNNLKIIRPDNKDYLIFDYLYVMEKAKEVHVMNSSIMGLIDTMQLRQDNLFYHRYVRGSGADISTKLNWKIIN